jgi:hypothetical protein
MNAARAIFRATFSNGRPSFSYMAKKNAGSIRAIIRNIAPVLPRTERVNRYAGMPMIAAAPKQSNCLLVRLRATFVLILLRSLGILT